MENPEGKILSFRNDALPKIAVTVDLLTTGIDVPKIENLVFLRRVNSRILYEQMLGRATRTCPEIGKETFRIFDAVDLYPHLQELTEMKPVVVDPKVTLAQLFGELVRVVGVDQREAVRDQLLVALRRRMSRFPSEVRAAYELDAGEPPEKTLERLRDEPLDVMIEWLQAHPSLGEILDFDPQTGHRLIPISNDPDHVIAVARGYGAGQKPEDFLDSFTQFIRSNVNEIAALTLVLQRPRDLTRAELKTLRLALDAQGFSEANLRRAWTDTKNEDMAASVIGYVRQAALGDPLVPFDTRVRQAMQKILARQAWTDVQRKWLKRIEEQLLREVVVDRTSLEEEPFRTDGGFQRMNKIFDGNLEVLLGDINEELWKAA